jgi:D-alanyl-D-alanine carboxypeptidase (penicillin-binding protein 5/6)
MFKKSVALFILASVVLLFPYMPASAAPRFQDIVAESAILAETSSGTVLFQHRIHNRHPAEALTRIMTLYLAANAVEDNEISDIELVLMTESAWFDLDSQSTTQSIMPGEEMTFIDLMYSAFVGSASEACNLIAERVAGSVEDFVELMNAKAKELGCEGTRFTNTHGRHHSNQYTTAFDLFLIYSAAMKNPLFAEITGEYRHTTGSTDVSEPRNLISTNLMLNQGGKNYYRYCLSGMSSITFEGGHSLVAYAEDGMTLISVVLGSGVIINEDQSTDLQNFTESRRLFEWGFANFAWRDILKDSDLVARVPIQHGSGADFVNARPESSITLLLSNDVPPDVFVRNITIYSDDYEDPLVAPVNAGDVLGEVLITRAGVEVATVLLIANTSVELHSFEYMRRQIIDLLSTTAARNVMILLALMVLIYIALVIRYNIIRANRLRRIRSAKSDLARERHENFRE